MRKLRISRKAVLAAVVAVVVFAAVTGVALLAYLDMESRTFDDAAAHTERVAGADAALVSYWLAQRTSDVEILSSVSRVRTEFPKYIAGDPTAKAWLPERLEAERATRDYVNVSIFTPDGKRVLSYGENNPGTDTAFSDVARSVASPTARVAMSSHLAPSGAYHVTWFAPMVVRDVGAPPVVTGVIMYEADLQRYLLDVIDSVQAPWPTDVEMSVVVDGKLSVARSKDGFAFAAPGDADIAGDVVKSTVALPWKGASISAEVEKDAIRSALAWARHSVRLADVLVLVVFVLFVWAYTRAEHNRLGEVEAREAIADALATQDRFLENMSHDLRTPLNSIIGFSALMRRGLAGDVTQEQARQLGMIEASGKHLLALVTDVLDLSKTKAGNEDVRPEWIVASEPVEFVSDVLAPLVAEKHLDWKVQVPEELEVRTDRRLLERILLNLAGNAVKFTHEGLVTMSAALRPHDEIAFTVQDTGSGIPSDSLDFIMQEFKQLHDPALVKPDGFGLGLAICRTTAALLGGRIEVESSDEGSTFTLVLPKNAGAVS